MTRSPLPGQPEPVPFQLLGWLGRFGSLAAAYAVFQALVGVLPDDLSGAVSRYCIAGLAGIAVGSVAFLSGSLLRARTTAAAAVEAAREAPGPLPAVIEAACTGLAAELVTVDDPGRGHLTGWPHSLGESDPPVRPTAYGTVYGLLISLELGLPDARLKAPELVDTLWRLRLDGGGWAARSQGAMARAELTSLVLGALARAGADPVRLAEEAAVCETLLTQDRDPSGYDVSFVVSTVIRGLLKAAPSAAALPRLRDALVDGAVVDPDRRHLHAWGSRLTTPRGETLTPTAVHTAQAIVALERAAKTLGEDSHTRLVREDGIRWLLSCPAAEHTDCSDLANKYGVVRRRSPHDPDQREQLTVRHFGAAWVARALMSTGARELAAADQREDVWQRQLTGAVAAVWAQQQEGIWRWSDGDLDRPLWMTYQGLSVLRRHALLVYRPHP
ncbi:hypothetical protein [Streptomyces sp. NBC_01465]|uniref:hypothetical protein n=1 Tax=Streptomyces sp. NBC_01465 TaxID=2903878 RepID=UPI002E3126B1|nr:hypothetical protein [Streptomyces sp. NBC_01465]